MSSQQLWKEYTDNKYSRNIPQKIMVLEKCANQQEDKYLAVNAKRDLGLLYFDGPENVRNIEKAKRYLGEAAEEGESNALFFYSVLLSREGNYYCFEYMRKAIAVGNIRAAYLMQDYLYMQYDDEIVEGLVLLRIKEQLDILILDCESDIENGDDEDGSALFALALVGLYDLGKEFGIDRKKGMEYLERSAKMKNGSALFLKQNPALLKPETMSQYKEPTIEELKKMEKTLAKEHNKQQKAPRKKHGKWLFVLILALVGMAVLFFFGEAIFGAVVELIKPIFPFICLILLGISLYIAYGDSDSGTISRKSSSNDSNPWDDYKKTRDLRNMPDLIYDSSSNQWSRVSASENSATYRNYDYGEITITSCDTTSKSAWGTGGHYHWY